ncbi:hypothetical protein HanPI659440_Chr11g0404521 [Helianthus annuus]|nr:hypothetical protein HanPI659440_Chr11g0404521 [Helianthus annuus]
MKRSRIIKSDDEYSSLEEMDSRECADPCKPSPEIEVRISGNSVLVRIHCQKNLSSLVHIHTQMQKLGLSIISRAANEPNEHEHEHDLVRVRLLRISCVHEQFTNTYRTRFFVRVRLLRK